MKNSTWFSCQLLMDVGVVAPSDETPPMQLHDLVRRDTPMTAYQLDLAEDENGEIDLWRLAFAQRSEAMAADWGFELETPDLEESRLRKKATVEVERRHRGFLMPDDCEEWAEFHKEVNAEVRRQKREAAGTKEKKASSLRAHDHALTPRGDTHVRPFLLRSPRGQNRSPLPPDRTTLAAMKIPKLAMTPKAAGPKLQFVPAPCVVSGQLSNS